MSWAITIIVTLYVNICIDIFALKHKMVKFKIEKINKTKHHSLVKITLFDNNNYKNKRYFATFSNQFCVLKNIKPSPECPGKDHHEI